MPQKIKNPIQDLYNSLTIVLKKYNGFLKEKETVFIVKKDYSDLVNLHLPIRDIHFEDEDIKSERIEYHEELNDSLHLYIESQISKHKIKVNNDYIIDIYSEKQETLFQYYIIVQCIPQYKCFLQTLLFANHYSVSLKDPFLKEQIIQLKKFQKDVNTFISLIDVNQWIISSGLF